MSRYNRSDQIVLAAYALLALGALVCTVFAGLDLMQQDDLGGLTGFLDDAVANPASTLLSIDLAFVVVVALVFMLVEGYRLGMRRLWIYVLLAMGIAISFALAVFLFMRHRRLAPARNT